MYSLTFPSGNGAVQTQHRKILFFVGSSLYLCWAWPEWGMIYTKGSHHVMWERSSISTRMLSRLSGNRRGNSRPFTSSVCVGVTQISLGKLHREGNCNVKQRSAAQPQSERRNSASDWRINGKLPCSLEWRSTRAFSKCIFSPKVRTFFFLSMVNSSSLQTSNLTALRTKEPVLYRTVGFYDFIFISMQCHKSI